MLGETVTRRRAFYGVTGLFVVLFAIITFPEAKHAVTGWGKAEALEPHQFHHILLGTTLIAVWVGMAVQLVDPERHAGTILQSAIVLLSIFTGWILGGFYHWPMGLFVALVGIALALHPSRSRVLDVRWPTGRTLLLVGLLVVAVGPFGIYAAEQLALQQGGEGAATAHDHSHAAGTDPGSVAHAEEHAEHVEEGHFASMAGIILAIFALGMFATLRPRGWWLPAWTAGVMAAVFGGASVVLPADASSLGPTWGALMLLWGVGFVAAAELTQDDRRPSLLGRWTGRRAAGT